MIDIFVLQLIDGLPYTMFGRVVWPGKHILGYDLRGVWIGAYTDMHMNIPPPTPIPTHPYLSSSLSLVIARGKLSLVPMFAFEMGWDALHFQNSKLNTTYWLCLYIKLNKKFLLGTEQDKLLISSLMWTVK